jgi:hypothetical protein
MSDNIDIDLDCLEALLTQAKVHSARLKSARERRIAQAKGFDISEDYAERLAEKATFRRLLSDEALDGVRFRWLWKHWERLRHNDFTNIEALRVWVDKNIALEEEKKRG